MVKINILEFHGYTEKNWLRFIRQQKTIAFDIALPKTKREPFDDKCSILTEYYIAACIGQELESVSEDFMYSVPALDDNETFNFIIITRQFKNLAFTLWGILEGFNKAGEPSGDYLDYVRTFHDCMEQWVAEGKDSYACPHLIQICRLLAKDSNDK